MSDVEEQSVAAAGPAVQVRAGAGRWWLRAVVVYLVLTYLGWTLPDLMRTGPEALLAGLYTLLFTMVMFGIPSLFMIGVVRMLEAKLPRWGFVALSVLAALVPLLLAPEAPLPYLMMQAPAQLSLVVLLMFPGRARPRRD